MKVIIGGYRAHRGLIQRAIHSLDRHLTGTWDAYLVDDSGDAEFRVWAGRYGVTVIPVADVSMGYNTAMKKVCEVAGDEAFMFWEEDFTLDSNLNLDWMLKVLQQRPYLAQLALLRQSWFDNEKVLGGVIPALKARLPEAKVELVDGIWEQTGTFTCNPAVWAAGIAAHGWPDGQWSEDKMRDNLLALHYEFGMVPGQMVTHDGKRVGFGY